MTYAKRFQGTVGAIVMARVSGDGQTENTSLDGQIDAGIAKAAQIGVPVLYTIREGLDDSGKQRGKSGAYLCDRPEMMEAISLIQQGKASHLICLDTSRYSRDMEDTFAIARMVETAGGRLVFTDFDYDPDDEGSKLGLTFRAGFATYERGQIKARTKRGRRRVITEQKIQPSRARSPYGYVVVNKLHVLKGEYPADMLGKYVIDDEKADFVQQAFVRYAGGMGLRSVCQWLTDAGAPPPGQDHKRGSTQWYAPTLRQILIRPVYKGAVACNRYQPVTDRSRAERGLSIYTHTERPEEEWIILDAPAIVDETLWDACQRRLMTAKEDHSGNPKHRYLLSGLLVCPFCGRSLVGNTVNRPRKTMEATVSRYYLCQQKRTKNGLAALADDCLPCSETTINYPGEVLEELVLRSLSQVADDPSLLEEAINSERRLRSGGFDEAAYKSLTGTLAGLAAQEQEIVALQLEASLEKRDTSAYKVMLKKITAERAAASDAMAGMELDRKLTPTAPARTQAEEMCRALGRVSQVMTDGGIETGRKREALAAVIEEIAPERTGNGGYSVRVKYRALTVGSTVTIILIVATVDGVIVQCAEKETARNPLSCRVLSHAHGV